LPLSTEKIHEIAAALHSARENGEPLRVPAVPLELNDSYAIQDAVARRHGGIDGWKVGAKGPTAIPTCAPLLRGSIVDCDTRHRDVAVKRPVGLEVEFAYRIGRDFDDTFELTDEDILDSVASAHVAVELCASRLVNAEQAPLFMLADNQMNERLVLGPAFGGSAPLHPASVLARLTVDAEMAIETNGGHPVGAPHRLLCWAVRNCVARFGGVKASQIITTGSWTGMHWITPPSQIEAEFAGFPSLAFRITRFREGATPARNSSA
jgi:2-keto-4-pentenoate hydratase